MTDTNQSDESHLMVGWSSRVDAKSGRTYYKNLVTEERQWKPPTKPAAQLPVGWTAYIDDKTQHTRYRNMTTGKDTSKVPDTDATVLPSGWEAMHDDRGRVYYRNLSSRETQWDLPEEQPASLPPGWTLRRSGGGKEFYLNEYTGETQWEEPKGPVRKPDPGELLEGWEVRSGKRREFYYNPISGETSFYAPLRPGVSLLMPIPPGPPESIPCSHIRGLNWTGNSCWLDSVIMCMLAEPSELSRLILDAPLPLEKHKGSEAKPVWDCGTTAASNQRRKRAIQEELRKMARSIRGEGDSVDYCSNLRSLLKKCKSSDNFHDRGLKDAGEFLGYLLSLFNANVAEKRTEIYVTNEMDMSFDDMRITGLDDFHRTSSRTDRNASIITQLPAQELMEMGDGVQLSSLLSSITDSVTADSGLRYEGKMYRRYFTLDTLVQAPYIVFTVERKMGDGTVNGTSIDLEEVVALQSGEAFSLAAVVMFSGLHYTAVFRCGGEWFHYDDTGGQNGYSITRIGGFSALQSGGLDPSPSTNGTVFFYAPIE